jgi:two-component system chemotaxis sensor kinase CheA
MLNITLLFESILQEKDTLVKNVQTVRSYKIDENQDQDEYVLVEFLTRVCNGAAAELNKKVLFLAEGIEGNALRKTSRQAVKEALTQLVYNAVYHGIEPSYERLAHGKPAGGVIRLSIKLEGNAIRIRMSDDGNGIDFERVREKAIERGILKETDCDPDKTTLVRAMFASGFSSASLEEGQDSGLGTVHSRVREMKGSIKVQSQQGKGTAFIIDIPLAVAEDSAA